MNVRRRGSVRKSRKGVPAKASDQEHPDHEAAPRVVSSSTLCRPGFLRHRPMARADHANSALPPVFSAFYFERDELLNTWPHAVIGKRGDVDEDFCITLRGLDEPEAAIVVPFDQGAVNAHVIPAVARTGFVRAESGRKVGRLRWRLSLALYPSRVRSNE